MTKIILLVGSILLLSQCTQMSTQEESRKTKTVEYAIVIHGGAGTITKKNMTDEKEKAYTDALNASLDAGIEILSKGGNAKDAVIEAIKLMEDSPLFNAGKGSVFTHNGENEMDASLMDGATLNAGAVGGVKTIKNPITAAEAVMTNSDHVMMVGEGAENFAISQGLDTIDPSYFKTERRWKSLQRIIEKEKALGANISALADSKYGTVGAVALDKNGNIVAGTSTGGMTNKKFNRIGDSPIIGAGTYANNKTCGVSCTGHGEYFIRYAVAHDVSALMEYKNMSVEQASEYVINNKLKAAGGDGGLIALDANGNYSMPFNTAGMYRGYANDKERVIRIYENKE